MILTVDTTFSCGTGSAPQCVHMPDGTLRVFYTDAGVVKARDTTPARGIYTSLVFTDAGRVSPDDTVTYPRLKKVPHHGAYGYWSAGGDHRFVIYMLPTDISDALVDGTVTYQIGSEISSLSCNLLNIRGRLLNRFRALATPGTKLQLYFSIGSAGEIPIGVFYVDTARVGYPEEKVSVNARNAIGKLLKEQTFDENTTFNTGTLQNNIKAILALGEVEDYFVGDPGINKPLEFEADTTLLDGIKYAIELLSNWKIEETVSGRIGVALKTDTRFDQPGTYTFTRDHTCWSYNVEYDDSNAASRVHVYSEGTEESDPVVETYQAVAYNKWWVQPSHRTLHVKTVNGATLAQCQTVAQTLAASLAASGRLETFAGLFTPQLIIGDEVHVIEENNREETVGTVTDVVHTFGKGGFYTSFTVDSGGRKGRARLKELITSASESLSGFTGKQAETQDGDGVSY